MDKPTKDRLKNATYRRTLPVTMPNILDYSQFAVVLRDLNKYLSRDDSFRPRKYKLKHVQDAIDNPESNQDLLRNVSQYLYVASGTYMRAIRFFSDMLTLDYVLVPNKEFKESAWERALKIMDSYNVKHEFRKILTIIMREDVFYGVEMSAGDTQIIHQLSPTRCRISSIVDGVFNFSVDCSVFNEKPEALEQLPASFKAMHAAYKRTGVRWQEVDDSISVCFKFHSDMPLVSVPPLVGVFEDVYDLDEAKSLAYTSDKMANYRLIVQKIPMKKDPKSEKDFLITKPTVEAFHRNIAKNIPDNIGLISTPMDVDSIQLDQTKNKERDNVERAEQNMWTSMGLGGVLHSRNDNSISLNRNINASESMMFGLLRQFERFFAKKVRGFKVIFPDLTIYNRRDMVDTYTKLGQSGFPKSYIAAAMGQSQSDMLNLLDMESKLRVADKMIPLKSSHVATNEDGGEGGRPTKSEGDLGDAGVKAREGDTNKTRAK